METLRIFPSRVLIPLSVIWILGLHTLVHGQGSGKEEGTPCYVRDENGNDILSQPQVSLRKFLDCL